MSYASIHNEKKEHETSHEGITCYYVSLLISWGSAMFYAYSTRVRQGSHQGEGRRLQLSLSSTFSSARHWTNMVQNKGSLVCLQHCPTLQWAGCTLAEENGVRVQK